MRPCNDEYPKKESDRTKAYCIVPKNPGGEGKSVLRLTTPMTRQISKKPRCTPQARSSAHKAQPSANQTAIVTSKTIMVCPDRTDRKLSLNSSKRRVTNEK